MKTSKLAAVAVVAAVLPAVVSIGCNKKEDLAPAPSATPVATLPPPPAAPAPPPAAPAPAPAAQRVVAKSVADGGARDGAAVLAVALTDAAVLPVIPGMPQGLPPIPTLHPSALPAIASGIVGGIVGAIPSSLFPPPPAPSR